MGVRVFNSGGGITDATISYFQTMDLTDGTWTERDTASFLKPVTYTVANGNTITTNALGVANDKLKPSGDGAGDSDAARYYKLATYDDGVPVMSGDIFVLTVSIKNKGSTAGAMRYFGYYFGICEVPTATTTAAWKFNGGGIGSNFANGDADVFGEVISNASGASNSTVNDVFSTASIFYGAGNATLGIIGLDAGNEFEGSASTVAGAAATAVGTQLYTCFTAGPRGNSRVFSDGDQTTALIRYKFSRISKNSMGLL